MTLALVERLDERLSPLERLEVLTDPGSLQPLRTQVRSRRMGDRGIYDFFSKILPTQSGAAP